MKNLTNVQQASLLNLISEEKSRLKEKADKERDPRMAQGYQDGADFWNPIYEYIKNLPVNPDEDVQRHLDKICEGIHKKH